jgi:hypothetical protein
MRFNIFFSYAAMRFYTKKSTKLYDMKQVDFW